MSPIPRQKRKDWLWDEGVQWFSAAPPTAVPERLIAEIVETFWVVGDLRCVLVRNPAGHLAVQVFIKDEAFVTDPCLGPDAAERAAVLLTIFGGPQTDRH